MLSHIGLRNYKSYNHDDIAFKPITVLCGGNSSGKTAIIKSLLLLKQSFESGDDNCLLLNGKYTGNGTFSEILCQNRTDMHDNTVSLSISFKIDSGTPSFRSLCKSIGMTARHEHLSYFEIHASFQFNKNAKFPQIGEFHSLTITLLSRFSDISIYGEETRTSTIIMDQLPLIRGERHYRIHLVNFPTPLFRNKNPNEYPFMWKDFTLRNAICYFKGLRITSLYQENISKQATNALPVLYTIFSVLESELNKLQYLGPLRQAPQRGYQLDHVYSQIGINGEDTVQYLSQFGEQTKVQCLPDGVFVPQKVALIEAVSQWLSYFGAGDVKVITSPSQPGVSISSMQTTQIMVGKQNMVDVGFGVSQMLPIIVAGLILPRDHSLIVEQPEVHLHPKMQMSIADFLLSIVRQGRQVIIETHSDHIINRLVRRAMEDSSLRDMLQIYYIEKDNVDGCSKLIPISVDPELGFEQVPDGFFDQYNTESETIFQIGYRNMQERTRAKAGHDKTDFGSGTI